MEKICTGCNQPIHPKRLEILPTATQCVACSTTGKKAGITVTKGEGDHTYNETIILEHEDFIKYQEIEFKTKGNRPDDITHPDDFVEEEEIEEEEDENLPFLVDDEIIIDDEEETDIIGL